MRDPFGFLVRRMQSLERPSRVCWCEVEEERRQTIPTASQGKLGPLGSVRRSDVVGRRESNIGDVGQFRNE